MNGDSEGDVLLVLGEELKVDSLDDTLGERRELLEHSLCSVKVAPFAASAVVADPCLDHLAV